MRGGRRKNSGRKKDSGISGIIANAVRNRVNEILDDILKSEKIKEFAIKEHHKQTVFSGWIYIIKDIDNGLYKVGISQRDNINSRMNTYKIHNMQIEIIYYDWVNYVNELEDLIHESINNFEKGDWFRCNLDTLCKILKIITEHKHNGRTQK